MSVEHVELRLIGTLRGTIWMPAIECTKDVDVKLSRDAQRPFRTHAPTFRDLLLTVTNDGDFQSCKLETACIVATIRRGSKQITRYWEVRGTGNEDCITA